MNEFEFELDAKDNYESINGLSFIDKDTVNVKYINAEDELVEKNISLNQDAEQVKQKLEAEQQEAKNASEMKKWLTENNITSVAQLQELIKSQAENQYLKEENTRLAQDLQKTYLDNTSLT
jgi:hypothetical protein